MLWIEYLIISCYFLYWFVCDFGYEFKDGENCKFGKYVGFVVNDCN